MARSWSRRHPGTVSSLGALGGAVVAAAVVALALGATAIMGNAVERLGGIAGVAAIVGALGVGVLLFRLARSGKLSPAAPAGGVGEQDATPVDAEPAGASPGPE